MKRVKTELGDGFNYTLDEIGTVQDNIKELTSFIGKGFGLGDSYTIVSGLELTITDSGGPTPIADITAGALWYLNEIYLFDEVVGLALPSGYDETDFDNNYLFDLLQTTNTAVVFKDTSTKDVVEVRKTILTTTPGPWVTFNLNYGGAKRLLDNIHDKFPSATNTIAGKIEIATQAEVIAGADTAKAVTPATLRGINNFVTVVIDIGFWNTQTIPGFNVAWPLPANSIIVGIEVMIHPNGITNVGYPLNGVEAITSSNYVIKGAFEYDGTQFKLNRQDGGFFADAAYTGTSDNRGKIKVTYQVV